MAQPGQHICIFGPTGSGKSYLAANLIRREARVLAFDPTGTLSGNNVAHGSGSLSALREVIAERWREGGRFAYVPALDADLVGELDGFARFVMQVQAAYRDGRDGRPLLVAVDECNTAYPNTSLPSDRDGFGVLIRAGRHYGVQLIGAAQRIAETSTSLRGNASVTAIFRPHGERDYQALRGEMGRDGEARARALGQWQYLTWADGVVRGPFQER